jgi:hypothetical protein
MLIYWENVAKGEVGAMSGQYVIQQSIFCFEAQQSVSCQNCLKNLVGCHETVPILVPLFGEAGSHFFAFLVFETFSRKNKLRYTYRVHSLRFHSLCLLCAEGKIVEVGTRSHASSSDICLGG